jgi:hypothetical protein
MNLVEMEGLQDVWESTIDYPQDKICARVLFPDIERASEDYITQPETLICWQGTRIPQWML